jgi:hypothetical protein
MMIEIVLLVSIIVNFVLGFFVYKSISQSTYYRGIFEAMYMNLGGFAKKCEAVLNNPIYSNEPVITDLIGSLMLLEDYLRQIEDFYTFDIELNENNAPMDGAEIEDGKNEED